MKNVYATFGRPQTLGDPGTVGDWLPTVVTHSDAVVLLDDVNKRVNETEDEFLHALAHKKITDGDFVRWQSFATRWRTFYNYQTDRLYIFFDVKAVMDTTDEYDQERHGLREWLKTLAPDETPGPDVVATSNKPGDSPISLNLLLAVAGVIAVAYVAGPPIRAWASKRFASA